MGKRKSTEAPSSGTKKINKGSMDSTSTSASNSTNSTNNYPPSLNSTSSLMQKIKELYTLNSKERCNLLSILKEIKVMLDEIVQTYFKQIKKTHPVKIAESELTECIEILEKIVSMSLSIIGNPGMGKSSLINMLLGMSILPSGGSIQHVTKSVIEVMYSNRFEVLISYCNEEEFNRRRELAPKEYATLSFSAKTATKKTFKDSNQVRDYLDRLYLEMNESDILTVEKIVISAPVQLLKDFNLTLRDTPGMNSGTFGKVFNHLIEQNIHNSNIVLFFNDGMRSDVSTSMFQQVINPVLLKAHKNSPSIKLLVGGRNIGHEDKDKGYTNFKSSILKNKIDFAKLLSQYANVDLDDVIQNLESSFLITSDENVQLDSQMLEEEFDLKNSRKTCSSIVEHFNTIVIPHQASQYFDSHKQDFLENIINELVQEQTKIISVEKNTISDLTHSLVPLLFSICVNNFSDTQIKIFLFKIEDNLTEIMKESTKKFIDIAIEEYNTKRKVVSYDKYMRELSKSISKRLKETISFKKFDQGCDKAIKEKTKQYSSLSLSSGRIELLKKNLERVIKGCKGNIKAVCRDLCKELIKNSKCKEEFAKKPKLKNSHTNIKNQISISMNELVSYFNGLFDRENNPITKVNLIVEAKQKLSVVFDNYRKGNNENDDFVYNLKTCLPIPSKEKNTGKSFKLSLPSEPVEGWSDPKKVDESWVQLKKNLSVNDSLLKKKIARSPSKITSEVIVDGNNTRLCISSPTKIQLCNPPFIPNLEKFQTFLSHDDTNEDSRIAPIMIYAPRNASHSSNQNFLLRVLPKHLDKDNYIVFILCEEEDWKSMLELVSDFPSFYVVKVECKKFNKGVFESMALELAKYYKFAIYHTMTTKTLKIQEYISSIKAFKSSSISFIRYFRFAEIAMQKEMLEVDKANLAPRVNQFLVDLRRFVIINQSNGHYGDFDCLLGAVTGHKLEEPDHIPESFLAKLRQLDEEKKIHNPEHTFSFTEMFLKIRLANNKARMVLWNGSSNMVKDFKVYNSAKNNYFVSYQHDIDTINTCYTPSMVNALEDKELFEGKRTDDQCEQSLKSGLLFSGAGQFICYGFKLEKNTDGGESE